MSTVARVVVFAGSVGRSVCRAVMLASLVFRFQIPGRPAIREGMYAP